MIQDLVASHLQAVAVAVQVLLALLLLELLAVLVAVVGTVLARRLLQQAKVTLEALETIMVEAAAEVQVRLVEQTAVLEVQELRLQLLAHP